MVSSVPALAGWIVHRKSLYTEETHLEWRRSPEPWQDLKLQVVTRFINHNNFSIFLVPINLWMLHIILWRAAGEPSPMLNIGQPSRDRLTSTAQQGADSVQKSHASVAYHGDQRPVMSWDLVLLWVVEIIQKQARHVNFRNSGGAYVFKVWVMSLRVGPNAKHPNPLWIWFGMETLDVTWCLVKLMSI